MTKKEILRNLQIRLNIENNNLAGQQRWYLRNESNTGALQEQMKKTEALILKIQDAIVSLEFMNGDDPEIMRYRI